MPKQSETSVPIDLKTVTPEMEAAVGKTFRSIAGGDNDARRFKVTSFTAKSARHKNCPAFNVERVGTDSYHEPYAAEFLRTFEQVPE